MKKIVSVLMIFTIVFAFAACSKSVREGDTKVWYFNHNETDPETIFTDVQDSIDPNQIFSAVQFDANMLHGVYAVNNLEKDLNKTKKELNFKDIAFDNGTFNTSSLPVAVIAGLAIIIYLLITYNSAMDVINIILCFVQMAYFIFMTVPDKLVVRLFTSGRKTRFYINATLLLCMFLSIANVFICFWSFLRTEAIEEYLKLIYTGLQAAFYISLYLSNIKYSSKITIFLFGSAYIAFYVYMFLDSPNVVTPDVNTATSLCVIAMMVYSYYFVTLKSAFYFQHFDLPVQSDDENVDEYIEPLYIVCMYRFEQTNHVIYRNVNTDQYYHGLLGEESDLEEINNGGNTKIYAEAYEHIFSTFSQNIGL